MTIKQWFEKEIRRLESIEPHKRTESDERLLTDCDHLLNALDDEELAKECD